VCPWPRQKSLANAGIKSGGEGTWQHVAALPLNRVQVAGIPFKGAMPCTANPTWGDTFESSFKTQSSKLERLFSLK